MTGQNTPSPADQFPYQAGIVKHDARYSSLMTNTASQIWEANLMRAYRVKKDEVVKRYPMQ